MYYLLKEMKTNFNDQTDGVKAYSKDICGLIELCLIEFVGKSANYSRSLGVTNV